MPSMPGLAILIGKKKPSMSKDDEDPKEMDGPDEEGEHSEDETKHAIMESLIDAVHEKDVDAALQAFHDLCQLCSEGSEEE